MTFKNFFSLNRCLAALGLLVCVSTSLAADTDFPNKNLSVVVAYAPGGQGDVFARLVSEKLSTV